MVFGLNIVHFDLVWFQLAAEPVILYAVMFRSWRHLTGIHLGKLDAAGVVFVCDSLDFTAKFGSTEAFNDGRSKMLEW